MYRDEEVIVEEELPLILLPVEIRPRMDPRRRRHLHIQAVRHHHHRRHRHDETNHRRQEPVRVAAAPAATRKRMRGNLKVLDPLDDEEEVLGDAAGDRGRVKQKGKLHLLLFRPIRAEVRALHPTVVPPLAHRLRRRVTAVPLRPIITIHKMSMYHPIGAHPRSTTTSADYVISR